MTLIRDAEGIFTGLPGEAMRAKGDIRIAAGRIAEIGPLTPRAREQVIDASGCVIYPGLVSTHQHLFQSILKGIRAGIGRASTSRSTGPGPIPRSRGALSCPSPVR